MEYTYQQVREMFEKQGILLRDKEWQVICLRLGLEDGEPKSLEETAEILGVTRERVRQIESMVMRRRPHARRRKKIRDFYT